MDTAQDFLNDTLLHIGEVQENLEIFASFLRQRGLAHDRSKLEELEFDAFVGTREQFKKANYGSDEYAECMRLTKPAVDHHYTNNPHHTGFHNDGVNDMNLVDIIEMLCDWAAAARRSPDKELVDTMEYAFDKYGIDKQLEGIIRTTLSQLGWI